MKKASSVEEYISWATPDSQMRIQQIRQIVKDAAPEAQEKISYGMPSYHLNGILLYIGYFKDHISLFALPAAVKTFENDLVNFKTSKGTIQFANDQPLPVSLIKKIVSHRVKEQLSKT